MRGKTGREREREREGKKGRWEERGNSRVPRHLASVTDTRNIRRTTSLEMYVHKCSY